MLSDLTCLPQASRVVTNAAVIASATVFIVHTALPAHTRSNLRPELLIWRSEERTNLRHKNSLKGGEGLDQAQTTWSLLTFEETQPPLTMDSSAQHGTAKHERSRKLPPSRGEASWQLQEGYIWKLIFSWELLVYCADGNWNTRSRPTAAHAMTEIRWLKGTIQRGLSWDIWVDARKCWGGAWGPTTCHKFKGKMHTKDPGRQSQSAGCKISPQGTVDSVSEIFPVTHTAPIRQRGRRCYPEVMVSIKLRSEIRLFTRKTYIMCLIRWELGEICHELRQIAKGWQNKNTLFIQLVERKSSVQG